MSTIIEEKPHNVKRKNVKQGDLPELRYEDVRGLLYPVETEFHDFVPQLVNVLSDEKMVFLDRPKAPLHARYVNDYSIVNVAAAIGGDPTSVGQPGWLIFMHLGRPSAFFHWVVREWDGTLKLVDNIPFVTDYKRVAFVPDTKNTVNFANGTAPCSVMLEPSKGKLYVPQRELNGPGKENWLPLDTKMFRRGAAPHQPSETMQAIGALEKHYEQLLGGKF